MRRIPSATEWGDTADRCPPLGGLPPVHIVGITTIGIMGLAIMILARFRFSAADYPLAFSRPVFVRDDGILALVRAAFR